MHRRPELFRFHGYSVDKVIREGATYKARVLRGWRGDQVCVIKDLSSMRAALRRLYGRRMLAREARALERLAGSGLAPRLLERLCSDAIAVELVWTQRWRKNYLRSGLPKESMPRVLQSLEDAVVRLHAAGVLHLDLRQRKNILVLPDDSVRLIDFESSWAVGQGWLARRLLIPLFGRIDRAAALKWKAKFLPEALTGPERQRVSRYRLWKGFWPLKRLGRGLRRLVGPPRGG